MPVWISSKTRTAPVRSHASRAAAITSSGTGWIPDSPWIGSSMTAAVLSLTASASASASSRGTGRNPGRYGSKDSFLAIFGVAETAPIVRPWKASSSTTISGSSMPRPWACLRTSLIASSTASAPELQRNALPPRLDSQSRCASWARLSLRNRLEAWM